MTHNPNQLTTTAFIVEAELADMYDGLVRDHPGIITDVYRLDDPNEAPEGFSVLQQLPDHTRPTFPKEVIADRLVGQDMAVVRLQMNQSDATELSRSIKPRIMARKAQLDREKRLRDEQRND